MNRTDIPSPERVRELMAGCYPQPRPDKRRERGKVRAARAAELVRRLGSVRAAAKRLKVGEKAVYSLFEAYGYDVKELRRAA